MLRIIHRSNRIKRAGGVGSSGALRAESGGKPRAKGLRRFRARSLPAFSARGLFILFAALSLLSAAAGEALLPRSLRVITEEAFAGDESLTRITVPEGTEEIRAGAFRGCAALEEITLPASLVRIDETAFEGCGSLKTVRAVCSTPACLWALEHGYAVLDALTGQRITPFIHDRRLREGDAPEDALQVVLVEYLGGSGATLSAHEKRFGVWEMLWETPALVGRNGIGKTREGDGRTPTGVFHLTTPFGILPDPGANMPYLQVSRRHYWCGTSGDPYYNRLVDEYESGRPCGAGDERLIDYAPYYNYCMFIDYNAEGVPGKGSCIFLHCKGQNTSTGGCVAVAQEKMVLLLRWALPGVLIVIR